MAESKALKAGTKEAIVFEISKQKSLICLYDGPEFRFTELLKPITRGPIKYTISFHLYICLPNSQGSD